MRLFCLLFLVPFVSIAQPEMKTLSYSIEIEAPIEKVYSVVIDKEHFKTWTSLFGAESTFDGQWEKDETIKVPEVPRMDNLEVKEKEEKQDANEADSEIEKPVDGTEDETSPGA